MSAAEEDNAVVEEPKHEVIDLMEALRASLRKDAAKKEKKDEPPPELDFCSRCKEHAEFEKDDDGRWLSTCCAARPVPVDVEEDDLR